VPPVEIYLGTEPAQFRATRAFLWSIEQVRDPGRVYRVHLMSQLAGFDRRGWTTGFTNYRFAIPHFAQGRGRAIYCDEDQIFLSDPGLLFDLDLQGAGYLAISDTETSVMLIDCARMAGLWTLDVAQHTSKKRILRRTLATRGIRGGLDPHWNARDEEYVAGRSHLLHYSTLHTQPWRPFPERFVYRSHRDERLWLDLERGAVEAGFEAFTPASPTSLFGPIAAREAARRVATKPCPAPLRGIVSRVCRDLAVGSRLEVGEGGAPEAPGVEEIEEEDGLGASCLSQAGLFAVLADARRGAAPIRDAVIVLGGLEAIPPEDMPWVVETLFRRARRFVAACVSCRPPTRPARGYPPTGSVHTRDWWVAHFETAGRRYPDVHWQLALADAEGSDFFFFRSGGRFPRRAPPAVWVLADDRPGNATQSIGLAEALGWPFERVDLSFSPLVYLPNPLLGASRRVLARASRERLCPPWPDLVIAAGRRTAPVARWISEETRGRTRIVQLGRKGANPADPFDLAISPEHARLCPHPNRFETAGALTHIRKSKLNDAARQWEYLFAPHPSPRIALLVGGPSQNYSFTPEEALAMARGVATMAARAGGSVFVTTSRRTGTAQTDAIARGIPDAAHFHRWSPEQKPSENPFLGYLALADVLVVTGESESMLAEASASEKSVHIYPLAPRRPTLLVRLGAALVDRVVGLAESRPRNNRGTTRPQQGLELLCSRLIARGFVRPQRDLAGVHETMVSRGLARMFDGSLGDAPPVGHSEVEDAADRVRAMMGT
jgi:hypothetical protein